MFDTDDPDERHAVCWPIARFGSRLVRDGDVLPRLTTGPRR